MSLEVRLAVFTVAVALASFACGGEAARSPGVGPRPCTEIGVQRGIAIDIDPALGPKVASAKVTVCRGGQCESPSIELFESEGPAITDMSHANGPSGVVAARPGPPTGGKNGFADLPDLTTEPVDLDIELRGPNNEVVAHPKLRVTAKMIEANGRGCGAGGPQANVVIDARGDGRVR